MSVLSQSSPDIGCPSVHDETPSDGHPIVKLKNDKIMDFRMQDRMELKVLADFYATESLCVP
jgi:hypothetical protein